MTIKLNLKSASIEEACCDELLAIKDNLIPFTSGTDGFSPNLPTSKHFFFLLTLANGEKISLGYCPSCGKKLICEMSMKEIDDQLLCISKKEGVLNDSQ